MMWVITVPFGAFTFKYYAFQSEGRYLPQAIKAYAVYLPAQLLSSVLLVTFVRLFTLRLGESVGLITIAGRTINPLVLISQLCTILFATVVSYLGHKYFTFRSAPSSEIERDCDETE